MELSEHATLYKKRAQELDDLNDLMSLLLEIYNDSEISEKEKMPLIQEILDNNPELSLALKVHIRDQQSYSGGDPAMLS